MFDPAVETLAWSEQAKVDDAAYRRQIEWLLARSVFYRGKLAAAGFADAVSVGGLADIGRLPFTEKAELRESCTDENPIGSHLCMPREALRRIYSTSGTTGNPSYIPLSDADLDNWITTSARSYSASGLRPGETVITTYNAGPFAAGAALGAFDRMGVCHVPVGTGNTERLIKAIGLLAPAAVVMTPSYAAHAAEWAAERGIDLAGSSVRIVMVAGEPGGSEPAMRERLERAWGARVTEAMGIGDVGVSLWGECEHQAGMHLGGRGIVHAELVDPSSGEAVTMTDGATGELVLTHLRHQAAPLLRFRTRDHVTVWTSTCLCGRTAPRVRCVGRTDDMLIVRGVNVFPSAIREIVGEFEPAVSGFMVVRPQSAGVSQEPPVPVAVELSRGEEADEALARRIEARLRAALVFTARVELVPHGSLQRSEYKSKLVERS